MLKDLFSSFFVIFVIVRVDEKVVHVDDEPSFSNHIPERVGHESLESGGGVGHAKEHNCGFIESLMGNESSLPLVPILDSDIVIPPSYIKLGEDLGIFEFVDEVRDQRKGVSVSDCVVVKVLVVLAGSKTSVMIYFSFGFPSPT